MNTGLRTNAKTDFKKDLSKLMKDALFEKTLENVKKHRDIKLVTTTKEGIIQNQNQTRENSLAIEMKKHTNI